MNPIKFLLFVSITFLILGSCKDELPKYFDFDMNINDEVVSGRGFYNLAYPNDKDHVGVWVEYNDPIQGKPQVLIIRRVPNRINVLFKLNYTALHLFSDSIDGKTPISFIQPEPYIFLEGYYYEDDVPSTIYTPDLTKNNTISFSKATRNKLHGQLDLNLYKMYYKKDSLAWTNPGPEKLKISIPNFEFDKSWEKPKKYR